MRPTKSSLTTEVEQTYLFGIKISYFWFSPYLFILLAGPPQHPPQLGDFETKKVHIIVIWVGVRLAQRLEDIVAVLDVGDVGDDGLAGALLGQDDILVGGGIVGLGAIWALSENI